MEKNTFVRLNVILTFCGMVFSGYLSAVKFFTTGCAFDEPCPLFLGHPACYYGFGMFSVMFISAALAWAGIIRILFSRYSLRIVSVCGILFAGYFTAMEVQRHFAGGAVAGPLMLPTCAYGLVFFALIFALSFRTVY